MKTKALEKSKHMLEMLYFEDTNKMGLIGEFLKEAAKIEDNYIIPFKRELDKNYLQKDNQNGVKRIIKYYINELLGANTIFSDEKQILADNNYIGPKSTEYQYPCFDEKHEISDIDKYLIVSYYIFNCHFYSIQEACVNNQIDFFELCRKVHFSWNLISTGITQSYRESDDYLNQLKFLQNQKTLSKDKKLDKAFHEFLIHENSTQLASELSKEFSSEKGKQIRILIEVLKHRKLINLGSRENTLLYNAIRNCFNQHIGSKQSIFNYNYSFDANCSDFENIEQRINSALKKANINK